jgi:hypothetical protein
MLEPKGVRALSGRRVEPEDDVERPVSANAANDEPTDDGDTPADGSDASGDDDNIPDGDSKE